MTDTFTTSSEGETMDLAAQFASSLQPRDIVTLHGPLGAGKTCFVRGLARGLGMNPALVSSPTFIICQEYERDDHLRLAHIDAYRLAGPDDLEAIGWEELVGAADTISAIEWPERIAGALTHASCIAVTIKPTGQHERVISIDPRPSFAEKLFRYRQ